MAKTSYSSHRRLEYFSQSSKIASKCYQNQSAAHCPLYAWGMISCKPAKYFLLISVKMLLIELIVFYNLNIHLCLTLDTSVYAYLFSSKNFTYIRFGVYFTTFPFLLLCAFVCKMEMIKFEHKSMHELHLILKL